MTVPELIRSRRSVRTFDGTPLSPDALELCHICLYGQSLMGSFFSGGDTPPEIEPLTKRIGAYLDAHKEKDPEPQS